MAGPGGSTDAVRLGGGREAFERQIELFEDDDVLNMFEMSEPADAALAGHSEINQQMGV